MPTASNGTQITQLMRLCGLASILVVLLFACQTVPVTGRKQVILLSASEENRMGITAYNQVLQEEKLSKDRRINAMVKRVGRRIAAVANRQDFEWEFRVIEKDIANAFALPGGASSALRA